MKMMKIEKQIRVSNILLFLSGMGILFALFFMETVGFGIWLTAKLVYLFSLLLLIVRR